MLAPGPGQGPAVREPGAVVVAVLAGETDGVGDLTTATLSFAQLTI